MMAAAAKEISLRCTDKRPTEKTSYGQNVLRTKRPTTKHSMWTILYVLRPNIPHRIKNVQSLLFAQNLNCMALKYHISV